MILYCIFISIHFMLITIISQTLFLFTATGIVKICNVNFGAICLNEKKVQSNFHLYTRLLGVSGIPADNK